MSVYLLRYVRSGQAMYVPVCADRHVTAKYSAGTCTRACPHCRISLSSPGLHGAKRAPQAGKQAVEPTAIQQPAIGGNLSSSGASTRTEKYSG